MELLAALANAATPGVLGRGRANGGLRCTRDEKQQHGIQCVVLRWGRHGIRCVVSSASCGANAGHGAWCWGGADTGQGAW